MNNEIKEAMVHILLLLIAVMLFILVVKFEGDFLITLLQSPGLRGSQCKCNRWINLCSIDSFFPGFCTIIMQCGRVLLLGQFKSLESALQELQSLFGSSRVFILRVCST